MIFYLMCIILVGLFCYLTYYEGFDTSIPVTIIATIVAVLIMLICLVFGQANSQLVRMETYDKYPICSVYQQSDKSKPFTMILNGNSIDTPYYQVYRTNTDGTRYLLNLETGNCVIHKLHHDDTREPYVISARNVYRISPWIIPTYITGYSYGPTAYNIYVPQETMIKITSTE